MKYLEVSSCPLETLAGANCCGSSTTHRMLAWETDYDHESRYSDPGDVSLPFPPDKESLNR